MDRIDRFLVCTQHRKHENALAIEIIVIFYKVEFSDRIDSNRPFRAPRSMIDSIRFDSIRFDSIRFDSIRFDSIRFDSIRFDSIRFDSIRFDSIRFDSIRFDSIRFDSIRFDSIRFDSIRFDSIRFDSIRRFKSHEVIAFRASPTLSDPFEIFF